MSMAPKVFKRAADSMMGSNEDDVMVNKTVNNSSGSNNRLKKTQKQLLDSLNFDDTTEQMQALKALIFNSNEIRNTKIAFIKEALSTDRYEIHSENIASKLMEFVTVSVVSELA